MIGNKKALPNLYSLPRPLRKEGSASPTQPPRRGEECLCTHERIRTLFSDNFCKILANLPPLLSEGSGEAVGGGFLYLYLSLCKTDSYKGICGTCYSSTPKNDCFLNKVAYLCKQRTEAPPDLPEGGGGKFASILQKLSEKESKVLILFCAHRHSSPFGEAGWGFSSSPRGEECRSRDCPKSFRS